MRPAISEEQDSACTSPRRGSGFSARSIAVGLALFSGYLLFDWLSFIHPWQRLNITPWNPQAAIVVFVLHRHGLRWFPVVVAAVITAESIVRHAGLSAPHLFSVSTILAAGHAFTAWLLTRPFAIDPRLNAQRDLIRLCAAIALGTAVTGIAYVSALAAWGMVPVTAIVDATLHFWVGDAVGLAVTLPLLLLLGSSATRARLQRTIARPEAAAQAGVIALALWFVFTTEGTDHHRYFYLLFLPLIWVSARDGLAGAVWSTAVVQVGVILLVQATDVSSLSVFDLQALLIALVATGLFLGVTADERTRAAERLRRMQHLASAGQITAGLAHELHQPLTTLAAYAGVIARLSQTRNADPALLHDVQQRIRDEVMRASRIVHRLRDFFRAGALQLERTRIDDLVRRVVAEAQEAGSTAGVEIIVSSPDDDVVATVDATQVGILVRNLLGNAIDAARLGTDAPPQVRIDVTGHPAHDVLVVVRDNGAGLTAARIDGLFGAPASSKPSGMGLGLAISRAIAQAHGGSLQAVPGQGGEFRLRLPRGEADVD